MCGIAGYSTIGSDKEINDIDLKHMLDRIHHRGPDESGMAIYPQVAIGNRRLSIIDVENGRQPIYNEDNSVVVVFNGEIYNSPELREELKHCGHKFSTNCDTEVLVHLYEEEGDDFVKRLNGMFAFSLYDKNRNRLLIARDRFGVKPLFYSYKNNKLVFASELKAMKACPDFDDELDPEGISVFLGLFYIPDPWTIYKHVRKLKPGHCLILSKEGLRDLEYYDLDFTNKETINIADAKRRTVELLQQSVKRQLLADVPVGVLLSGGLDSRSVLSAASSHNTNTESFTIGFDESAFDECNEAAEWSALCNSKHNTLLFDEDTFCQRYLERQRDLDEPYALWVNVATAELSRFIHSNGFKVVLSGEGGDELFLGYPTIHAANAYRLYQFIPEWIRKKIITPLVNSLPAGNSRLPLTFKLKSFVNADNPDICRTFFGFKEIIRYESWNELLTSEALEKIGNIDPYIAFSQYKGKISNMSFIDGLSYLDFKVFLPGSSFIGNDNAFMSSSVESRVPFMDNDLVDFVCSLPESVRFHPLKPKNLLRKALEEHFVKNNSSQSKSLKKYRKLGFEVPGNVWMKRKRFSSLMRQVLSPERLSKTGFFKPDAIQKLLEEQLSQKQNHERILQAVMSLNLFLEGHYE